MCLIHTHGMDMLHGAGWVREGEGWEKGEGGMRGREEGRRRRLSVWM